MLLYLSAGDRRGDRLPLNQSAIMEKDYLLLFSLYELVNYEYAASVVSALVEIICVTSLVNVYDAIVDAFNLGVSVLILNIEGNLDRTVVVTVSGYNAGVGINLLMAVTGAGGLLISSVVDSSKCVLNSLSTGSTCNCYSTCRIGGGLNGYFVCTLIIEGVTESRYSNVLPSVGNAVKSVREVVSTGFFTSNSQDSLNSIAELIVKECVKSVCEYALASGVNCMVAVLTCTSQCTCSSSCRIGALFPSGVAVSGSLACTSGDYAILAITNSTCSKLYGSPLTVACAGGVSGEVILAPNVIGSCALCLCIACATVNSTFSSVDRSYLTYASVGVSEVSLCPNGSIKICLIKRNLGSVRIIALYSEGNLGISVPVVGILIVRTVDGIKDAVVVCIGRILAITTLNIVNSAHKSRKNCLTDSVTAFKVTHKSLIALFLSGRSLEGTLAVNKNYVVVTNNLCCCETANITNLEGHTNVTSLVLAELIADPSVLFTLNSVNSLSLNTGVLTVNVPIAVHNLNGGSYAISTGCTCCTCIALVTLFALGTGLTTSNKNCTNHKAHY